MPFKKRVSKSIDADSELILSNDYYLHTTIMQAIKSPFKALEAGSFNEGLRSVQLAGYLTEKLAASGRIFNEEEVHELREFLSKERKQLIEEGIDEGSETMKTMLAYSKICWIMGKVEENKPTSSDYKV